MLLFVCHIQVTIIYFKKQLAVAHELYDLWSLLWTLLVALETLNDGTMDNILLHFFFSIPVISMVLEVEVTGTEKGVAERQKQRWRMASSAIYHFCWEAVFAPFTLKTISLTGR